MNDVSRTNTDDRVDDTIMSIMLDRLCLDGFSESLAEFTAMLLREELRTHPTAAEMFIFGVMDVAGSRHICVAPRVPASGTVFGRLNIADMRDTVRDHWLQSMAPDGLAKRVAYSWWCRMDQT